MLVVVRSDHLEGTYKMEPNLEVVMVILYYPVNKKSNKNIRVSSCKAHGG